MEFYIREGKTKKSVNVEISLGPVTTALTKTERFFTRRELDVIRGILKPDDFSFIDNPKYYNKSAGCEVLSNVKKRVYKIDKFFLIRSYKLPKDEEEILIYPDTNWKFPAKSLEDFIAFDADSVAFYILNDYANYLNSLSKVSDSFVKKFQDHYRDPKMQKFRKEDFGRYVRGTLQFFLVELPCRVKPYSSSDPSPYALEVYKPEVEDKKMLRIFQKRLEDPWKIVWKI